MRVAIAVVAVLVLSGCGRSAWLPSDIDRDEALDELGALGYQRVCSAFEGYVRDSYKDSHLVQAVCLAYGVQQGADAVQCGELTNQCTNTLPPAAESVLNSILAQGSCSNLGVDPVGCAATVAQLSSCLEAIEDKIDDLKFGLTCAAVGETVDPNWWRIPLPAQCEALRTLCPAD